MSSNAIASSLHSANRRETAANRAEVRVRIKAHANSDKRRQGIFWILTIPHDKWAVPEQLPVQLNWLRGQLERGTNGRDDDGGGGYLHYQLVCAFKSKVTLRQCQSVFGGAYHAELTISKGAAEYVWKEATRVDGTQFELGAKPIDRASSTDWEEIWNRAESGDIMRIPANIRVVSYRTIRAIGADFAKPVPTERKCYAFIGTTATGKSRRAWEEAGEQAYSKCPMSKFWNGYQGQSNVVIDEFRGDIAISHMLRWTDRYACHLDTKGASQPSLVKNIWITSNIDIDRWYPLIDPETVDALKRRITVVYFPVV